MSNFDLFSTFEAEGGFQKSSMDQVLEHLERLLNTRQGMVVHEPDFGLSDIFRIYLTLPGSAKALEQELTQLIATYEPRLNQVKVVKDDNKPGNTVFRIIAELEARNRSLKTLISPRCSSTQEDR